MHKKIYSQRTTKYGARFQHLCIAVSVMMVSINTARAQDAPYPSKVVRFIVGQAPGGATDIVGRMVAAKLTDSLGQGPQARSPQPLSPRVRQMATQSWSFPAVTPSTQA